MPGVTVFVRRKLHWIPYFYSTRGNEDDEPGRIGAMPLFTVDVLFRALQDEVGVQSGNFTGKFDHLPCMKLRRARVIAESMVAMLTSCRWGAGLHSQYVYFPRRALLPSIPSIQA